MLIHLWGWSGLTMLSMHSVGISQLNQLTGNSSGNAHPQPSQLTELPWSDPWPKEWSCCVQADVRSEKKKKSRWGVIDWTFPQNPCIWGKSHHHHHHHSFISLILLCCYPSMMIRKAQRRKLRVKKRWSYWQDPSPASAGMCTHNAWGSTCSSRARRCRTNSAGVVTKAVTNGSPVHQV